MATKKAQAKAARDATERVGKILPSKIWPLDKIKEYPNNPKNHPPAQIELLARIFRKYGPDQDIVVDEDGIIIKGHGRKSAAKLAEMKGYPVTQRIGLSDADKRGMRIQDNALPLLGSWDNQLVQFEIETLKRSGYEISLLGFGAAQLVQFETVPQPPGSFPEFGDDISTQFCCPACKYAWSGDPLAGKVKGAEPEKVDDPVQMRVRKQIGRKGRSRAPSTVSARASLAGKAAAGKGKARQSKS